MSSARPSPQRTRRGTVTPIRPLTNLAAAQAALARGAWKEAKRAFRAALNQAETPEAHEGLGLAAWWLNDGDLVFESRRRAFRLYRHRDDRAAAARVAVWLAWDSAAFLGETAVASGWLERARHLLQDVPERAEHAWLAVRAGVFALLEHGDPDRALAQANDAIRIGRAVGAVDFEMIGGALRGFALVTAGRVADGMRQLDEVNAAVLAGELTDPVAIALSGCYLVAACERVRDAGRAVQWCRRVKRFCEQWGLKPLLAVCRTQYASICVWRGEWSEAEAELVTATRELENSRPAMSGEGRSRLGELRRRQGRLDEAERLFDAAGAHPIAAVGRIELALDRSDARRAIDLAERYLRQLPVPNLIERAAGLELLARACTAGGRAHAASAAEAARELTHLAEGMGTTSARASSHLAAGLVAATAGDDDEARRHLEDAVDLYEQSEAPFETARTRLHLASVLRKLDRMPAALDEVGRATKTLVAIDAAAEVERARTLDKRLRSGTDRADYDAAGLTARELEIVRLIAGGLTNPRIGRKLFISPHTVHRHVANIFTKLDVQSRAALATKAAALGLLIAF